MKSLVKNFVLNFAVFTVGHFVWEYFFPSERELKEELPFNAFAATVIALSIYFFNKLVAMANRGSDST